MIGWDELDWSEHTPGDPECKGCANFILPLDPYLCEKPSYDENGVEVSRCQGLIHHEFQGETYDEESGDCWPDYNSGCDVHDRPQEKK